jgi:hypothetical protein
VIVHKPVGRALSGEHLPDGAGAAASRPLATITSDKEDLPPVSSRRIWKLAAPEKNWIALAVAAAIVNGCTFPLYSLLLSTVVSYFYGEGAATTLH